MGGTCGHALLRRCCTQVILFTHLSRTRELLLVTQMPQPVPLLLFGAGYRLRMHTRRDKELLATQWDYVWSR